MIYSIIFSFVTMNKSLKKGMFLFCFLNFLLFPNFSFASTSDSGNSWILSELEEVNKNKETHNEKESYIKYEKDNIEENKSKIEQVESLNSELKDAEESINTIKKFYTWATDIKNNSDYKDKIKNFDSILSQILTITSLPWTQDTLSYTGYTVKKYSFERKVNQFVKDSNQAISDSEKAIQTTQEDLKIASDEVRKSETNLQVQIQNFAIRFSIFLITLVVLFSLRKIIKRFIKSSSQLSDDKKWVFLSIIKWIISILVIIINGIFFFSEFVSVLPFLAIIWTALWLALRDIISSFIAWFVIWLKDSTYKLWDIIEIEADKIYGKVVKITSLSTFVQQIWFKWPEGIYLSFPNKRIFEIPVKNYSRMNSRLYINLEFFLEKWTDITDAKESLLKIMKEVTSQIEFRSPFTNKGYFKKFWYKEDSLAPQVFVEMRSQGIVLIGKLLWFWKERYDMKYSIEEKFITYLSSKRQEESKIKKEEK